MGCGLSGDYLGRMYNRDPQTFRIWLLRQTTAEEILRSVNDDNENIDLSEMLRFEKHVSRVSVLVKFYPATYEHITRISRDRTSKYRSEW